MNIFLSIHALFSALLITTIVTPLIIAFAQKFQLLDDASKRNHPANTHTGIIPRAGGLAIYIGLLITSVIFIPSSKILTGILVGSGLIVLVGIFDDKYDLSPYVRFVLNILIVLITILFGLGIPYFSNPLGGVIHLDSVKVTVDFFGRHNFLIFANIFALLWVVALMNFVNWSSGVDGQLPGFVAIASVILGLLAFRFTSHDISSTAVVMLAFIIAGAFLGFLPWNFYPQKIMPGYSGGALAGFLLGVLSILSWGKIGTLALVLAVPFIDAIYAIGRRITHRKSPFKGDASHFHHRLLRIGWGRRRIAVFYWCSSYFCVLLYCHLIISFLV
jgi:UDP-GlcNAc:undecaprenyl-phosphate GlcNAc-1-phosphate transferase